MNQAETIQKLVDMLGRSENDPELQALFIELGEKFPLKRPRRDDNNGYLLEDNRKKNRGYHLGVRYAFDLPLTKDDKNFSPKELVFYSIQGLSDKKKFKDVVFPFGITWEINSKQAIDLLGEVGYVDDLTIGESNAKDYAWRKGDVVVSLTFNEQDSLIDIFYTTLRNPFA